MKRILGLDLGTNSIGWSVILAEKHNEIFQLSKIEAAGSRIIPMDAAVLGDFDRGNSISQTAERTRMRGVRRLLERCILRRERLHRVLDILGFLPSHYSQALDRYGKFLKGEEPKLAWRKDETRQYTFLFQNSFHEMLEEFHTLHPELIGKKIPYDWTIYYLRKKALSEKISKEELAWILLNFNQKRGYYQLREEEISNNNKKTEYFALKVVAVEDSGEKKGKDTWYNVHLENGWIYRRTSNVLLDWVGKTKEFIVTTDLNDDGTFKKDKEGNIKRSFRSPSEDDWNLIKERTQTEIEHSGKTVGAYIYDTIIQNPNHKIRGKLVRTIERMFYKEELTRILNKQTEFHPELQNNDLYQTCIEELYPSNEAYRQNITKRNFTYLFIDDILFYQRPLKTKKSLIANCPYEDYVIIDKTTGEKKHCNIKCIAKSHPLYQEFRLWQFISNLRIYKKELANDIDVTKEFLRDENDYEALFDWLNNKKIINQKAFFAYKQFNLKKNEDYRWNYVEDKDYPCNETRAQILSFLSKSNIDTKILTADIEEKLWHILYSIEDKQELTKALTKFSKKQNLNEQFVEIFQKFPPFKKEYGAYSAKAIKRLIPLMRMGKYWMQENIDQNTLEKIEKIITGEFDDKIKNRVREKAISLTDVTAFKALPLWLACYIVYNRHSEAKEITKWTSPNDLQAYLNSFKQHSLRNPIVEQVITETLRTVHDIWKQYGNIDEIHIELGREMKNPADKRRKMTQQIQENENANLRIKKLLMEFANPEFGIENVRPYSPSQQEILRIYEEGALASTNKLPEEIESVIKKFKESDTQKQPTRSEVLRYKLWLEQKYRSPYTGQPIPLAKLFTPAYEIEHIIPQSLYFDDSLSNKVICESVVNKRPYKDNQLGFQFIKNNQGRIVQELSTSNKTVKIFTIDEYEQFIKDNYSNNRSKMRKLMMETIPDEFIARQLNDSRYISKVIKGLLSNIVREDNEEEAISKNVIVCTGGVTDRLKKDWGMNDVWNRIILPRFLRLNEITGTNQFTTTSTNGHEIPSMPLELQKGFNKKRIDHRHHAMDAIIIACANRNIVNYLNNESASKNSKISRDDLKALLCEKSKTDENGNYKWIIKKPWENFTKDVYNILNEIIVSFKKNLRIINKATNYYTHFKDGKKEQVEQTGTNWAIRKPMHKDTVFGEVSLRKVKTVSLNEAIKNPTRIVEKEFKIKLQSLLKQGCDAKKIKKFFEEEKDVWQDINLSKIKVYYFTKETKDRYFATRKTLTDLFTSAINEKKEDKKIKKAKDLIEKITDEGIQTILFRHLEQKNNDPELAFSPDGIDEMNRNIVQLNNGKYHQPIFKVRVYEKADKFAIGVNGNKSSKFVEAADNTNLYFAIYETEKWDEAIGEYKSERKFATIPLNIVIERSKQGLPPVPADENGNKPKYVLSPNDLVYVPTIDEITNNKINEKIETNRIYKMRSANKSQCFFIKSDVASVINMIDEYEFTSSNKMERALTGEMIKEVCIPIKVDRLGNITKVG